MELKTKNTITFYKGVTPTELKTKTIITFYKGAAPTELKTTKIFRTSNCKKQILRNLHPSPCFLFILYYPQQASILDIQGGYLTPKSRSR